MNISNVDVKYFINNCDIRSGKIVKLTSFEKFFSFQRKKRLDAYVKKQLEAVSLTNPNSINILQKANEYRRTFHLVDKAIDRIFIDRYLSAHFNDQFQLRVCQQNAVSLIDAIGLDGSLAKKYPDFVDFLQSSELVKKMKHFRHHVKGVEGQPALLYEGKWTKWSELKNILGLTGKKPSEIKLPYGYRYVDRTVDKNGYDNPYGIVKQDLIKWKKLSPTYMHQNQDLLGKYFIEIVGNTKNGWGHHWFRLIDEKGNVFAPGFNRGWVPFLQPLAMYKGKIMQMDPCEYEDYSKVTTLINVSSNEFASLIKKIENDNNTGNIGFSYYRKNCAKYTSALLEHIGIKVDNNEYPSQSFARRVLEYFRVKELCPYIGEVAYVIVQVVRHILAPFFNVGLWILGVNHVDWDYQQYLEENDLGEVKPIPFSLFSTETFRYSSPYKLRQWQHWVANRRANLLKEAHIHYMEGKISEKEYNKAKFDANFKKPPSLETDKLFVHS